MSAGSVDFLLHEYPIGYAVFKIASQPDSIGNRLKEVQDSVQDLAKFGKLIELVGFTRFPVGKGLEEAKIIYEGNVSDLLRATLETNLPKAGKKKAIVLGLAEKNLANSVKAIFPNLACETSETSEVVADLLRGLRQHGTKLLKKLQTNLQEGDIEIASFHLGHAVSKDKVKFSRHQNDNHIIQAIATLDQLDKDVNLFCMRLRENYGWHFPELVKIVSNNEVYAPLVLAIGDKSKLTDDDLHRLAAIVNDDEGVAQSIINAARTSMGRDLSETDMENVLTFAKRASSLATYRKTLSGYLSSKMSMVAPNLAALIGDTVGARLISKAGSLTNLSKYPASTVQILGAEKALFRALKTKGNTPKYGLIYHSSFIGKTGVKSKGRISRFLANKCSIASRIDKFSEFPTSKFGEALKRQVEERIEFYSSGATPAKNSVVMQSAMDSVLADINVDDPTAAAAEDVVMADGVTSKATEQVIRHKKEKKEKKKDKKSKKVDSESSEPEAVPTEKKSKKEKRKSDVNGEVSLKKRKHADEVDGESKKKKKKSKSS